MVLPYPNNPVTLHFSHGVQKVLGASLNPSSSCGCLKYYFSSIELTHFTTFAHKATSISPIISEPKSDLGENECKKITTWRGKKEHHLWQKRDAERSGQKALHLVRIISGLPNEKAAVYSALDKWVAWETEFPLIAAAKALKILRKRSQWNRVIQLSKWMLSKGQGATMGTYDTILLAFDMEKRVDEAETLWNMILHAHTRSVSKRLFSRMISLYDHHGMSDKVIQIFADMEELRVKPDEDTITRIARAFVLLGEEDKQKLFLKKYRGKWKYVHFKGERIRVRRDELDD